MTRQRRGGNEHHHKEKSGASDRRQLHRISEEDAPKSRMSWLWTLVMLALLAVASHLTYTGYLETRVTTKFDNIKMVEKTGLDVPKRYWGSYRSGVYFGMSTREPHSPVLGLMWYQPQKLVQGAQSIRHSCDQGDKLQRYGWLEHDGINFGVQELVDGPVTLKTTFVKRGHESGAGEWSARIEASSNVEAQQELSLIFYVASEEKAEGWIQEDGVMRFEGHTPQLGDFFVTLLNYSNVVHSSQLVTKADGLHRLKDTIMASLKWDVIGSSKFISLGGVILPKGDNKPNFIATQLLVKTPFTMEVVYQIDEGVSQSRLSAQQLDEELQRHRGDFKNKFEKVFRLKDKGYSAEDISSAKATFSNLLGGIGYFYGSSLVMSKYTEEPRSYWKAPLYTAVPSRSFFPRGFLWDEGFHELLVSTWDLDISLDVIAHWLDLMNIEGWIPREQILGEEARSRVPDEFVVQKNENANPPTFLLTLKYILTSQRNKLSKEHIGTIAKFWPRLQKWFSWYNVSQIGPLPGSYRWRGRDPNALNELNPKTLTSGLDDYPRASHPTEEERHIDLTCWMAMASQSMAIIADRIGQNGDKYLDTYTALSDPLLMNKLFWSGSMRRYADFGLHTDAVKLGRKSKNDSSIIRFVQGKPKAQLVDKTFGYVSLFPFLLCLIPPNSPKLGDVLNDLKKPELLWTPYGLRSLSTDSPMYLKKNTEHDAPYWRGPIWMNINYLAVKALHHYSQAEGPFKVLAGEIYKELCSNLVTNILKRYKDSGFVYEQYNDKTGEGQGCKPFTGWSALVVLIMGEIY
ncbi:mannosyl-oligosaccharide glucosidase-like isoform X1 [Neocloeon triangulifer]|uniref:mannosyl-oligosaccharide glucosidase-like isoform X1 n=1 Tax=Neocloeon triangulifer TaxID=2078957 RepID=UPI00286ECD99|nr:mannosyl-oligosaccharide glucosidase-like isoform X1 [Neocloeon triangulifer]XP_059484929.1 mannosyl-oligosaccharide glucosidase-like isoform X1 [Neocloeon triangulifer]